MSSDTVYRYVRNADIVIEGRVFVWSFWLTDGIMLGADSTDVNNTYWYRGTEEALIELVVEILENEEEGGTLVQGVVPGHPEYKVDNGEYYTIEPGRTIDGVTSWWHICHGKYPESSVLAGQDRHTRLECYYDLDEAKKAHPDAVVQEYATLVNNHMSQVPPSWFDPAAAGERWSEDD